MQLFKLFVGFLFLAHSSVGIAQKGRASSTIYSVNYKKKTDTTEFLMMPGGSVHIKGRWEKAGYVASSRQYFLKNQDSTTIAISKTVKKGYPFFEAQKTNWALISDYYKWDSDFLVENGFQQELLKSDSTQSYIIWRVFNSKETDNFFIFGMRDNLLTSYLISSNKLEPKQKVAFLEDLYLKN